MIMKTIGPELGDYLYPIIAKHSKDVEAYLVEYNKDIPSFAKVDIKKTTKKT